ncbi:MAG TPA: type II toxin-antitoxin system RatA family toxin [Rhizomicrobium sp.]|nr:type II toxin-antitoxin system RatA family toxin [Rhizomicrobium sp.]
MTSHSESRIVPYSADRMYAIVADVERYPEFVPWTVSLRVLKREPFGEGEVLTAETVVGFRALRERYKSRVVLDPKARTVDVTQVEGVFRELENHWRFTPESEGCRVDFSIRFAFKSRMLEAVAGAAFGLVVTQMTRAFEERARNLSEKSLQ